MFAWPRFLSREPRKPRPDARIDVVHGDATYSVRVQRHSTARRLILKVKTDSGEPVLTLPQRSTLATAKQFLEKHGGWIAARMARLPEQTAFAPGAVLPFRGVDHTVVHEPRGRGAVQVREADGVKLLVVSGDISHLPRRLGDFLKREARRSLSESVAVYAGKLNVKILRISVKDTKSRWGSCSAAGALSFSWRLIFAPGFVLDYLAAHEVAHRLEMNHSRRYWRIVADICPHWQEAEVWLKANGAGLHRFSAATPRTRLP